MDETATNTIKPGWGRVMKRMLLWTVVIAVGLIAIVWFNIEVENYETFKRDLVEFENIKIGAPMVEVRYALGQPKWVLGENLDKSGPWGDYQLEYEVDATSGPNIVPKGKSIEDFSVWEWQEGEVRIDVRFDPKTNLVTSVGCYVNDPSIAMFQCDSIGSLHAGDSEDSLVRMFGSPDRVNYNGSSPTKVLYYDALGLEVYLTKRQVYLVRKHAPGNVGLLWWMGHGRP